MDLIDGINLAGSIVSIVLGVLAIGISLYFYRQSKDSEAKVQIALEGIKAQTETLQTLSQRYMDRLTKYVTTPRTEGVDGSKVIVEALDRIPKTIETFVLHLKTPNNQQEQAVLLKELVDSYIGIFYYVGTTNVWASLSLPSPEDFDPENQFHIMVKDIVDRSYNAFQYMERVVSGLDPKRLQGSTLLPLLTELIKTYRPLVRDTAQTFALRAKAAEE